MFDSESPLNLPSYRSSIPVLFYISFNSYKTITGLLFGSLSQTKPLKGLCPN